MPAVSQDLQQDERKELLGKVFSKQLKWSDPGYDDMRVIFTDGSDTYRVFIVKDSHENFSLTMFTGEDELGAARKIISVHFEGGRPIAFKTTGQVGFMVGTGEAGRFLIFQPTEGADFIPKLSLIDKALQELAV